MRIARPAVTLATAGLLVALVASATGTAVAQADPDPHPPADFEEIDDEVLLALVRKGVAAILGVGGALTALTLVVDRGSTAVERRMTVATPPHRRSPRTFGTRLALAIGALVGGYALYQGGSLLRWTAALAGVAALAAGAVVAGRVLRDRLSRA